MIRESRDQSAVLNEGARAYFLRRARCFTDTIVQYRERGSLWLHTEQIQLSETKDENLIHRDGCA
jgi:hypothetical protein